MYRYNLICSPEMSFCGDSGPHAYVAYSDGGKEVVPVSFVYNFPSSWRDGWNKNYLFKTFWSPDDEDSPSSMLKRVAEIPTFPRRSSMEQPGYYRAAVIFVAETRAEVEAAIEKKRPSVGVMKLKYTSFEKKDKKAGQKKTDSSKLSSRVKKSKKKKGLNVKAQTTNTADLRSSLLQVFPQLTKDSKDSSTFKESGGSSGTSDTEQNDNQVFESHDQYEQITGTSREERGSAMTSFKVAGGKGIKQESDNLEEGSTSEDLDRNSPLELTPQLSNPKRKDSINIVASDSFSLHKTMTSGNCKLGGIKRQSSSASIKALETTNLWKKPNLETQAANFSLDSSREALGLRKITQQSRKQKVAYSSTTSDEEISDSQMKLDPDFTPRKYVRVKEELDIQLKTVKRISDLNLRLQENLVRAEEKSLSLENKVLSLEKVIVELKRERELPKAEKYVPKSKKENKMECDAGSFSTKIKFSVSSSDDDNDPMSVCNTSWSEVTKSDNENSHDVESKPVLVKPEPQPNEVNTSKEICPGVVLRPEVAKIIWSIATNEKKDLRFIKDLSLACFGPEVLASSTIAGTKKGGRKLQDDTQERVKKPALDKKILEAIYGLLIKRVVDDEKLPALLEPNEHSRTNKKRFHSAIQDAIKRSRLQGYGQGKKTNEVTLELFKE